MQEGSHTEASYGDGVGTEADKPQLDGGCSRESQGWTRPGRLTCRPVVVLSLVGCGLGLAYVSYRGYYALGGTAGMFGVPESQAQWAFLNAFAAVGLLVASAVPIVALPLWDRRVARPILLTLFTVAAVGLVMHALIDETQRLLHLAGLADRFHIHVRLAGWRSVDMRASDVQDILLNEPWFLGQGLVCGALVWVVLHRRARTWWLAGAAFATAVCTTVGVLSTMGVVGRWIVF